MSELLEVPQDSIDVLHACWSYAANEAHRPGAWCVRAIAGPVVAAELRRLAADFHEGPYSDERYDDARQLEERANELTAPEGRVRTQSRRQALTQVIAAAMDPGTQPPQEAPYSGLKLADHIARAVIAAEERAELDRETGELS